MSEERSMTFPSNKKILNYAPKTALSEVIIFIGGNLEMLFKKKFYISHIVSNVSWRINEKSLRKFDLHIRQNLQINPFVPRAPSWGKERVHWERMR